MFSLLHKNRRGIQQQVQAVAQGHGSHAFAFKKIMVSR